MSIIKIDRDALLDKIYECRGKIDYTNREALKTLEEIVDIVVHSELLEAATPFPKIKIGR